MQPPTATSGNVYERKEQFEEAIACYQKALQLNPNFAAAYCNLGNVYERKEQFEEAIVCYQKALQLNPNFADVYSNLSGFFTRRGKKGEAETYCKRALQINPDDFITYSNLLLIMNYNGQHNAQNIFSEHLKFAKKYEELFASAISPHNNNCIPNRRLKIGYISPDFREQSVGFFIEPVLASHNHHDFEIFCYHNLPIQDARTKRMQGYADHWRSIVGMSDKKVSELIREDGIDIFIDLAGHTGFNRILVFARKPAPVQVSWIGYPNTTGLSTMDYKIVDNYTDPPGMTEQFYSEQLLRLPNSFLCYLPDNNAPDVGDLPALTNNYLTFGSFNNYSKISSDVFELWITILKRLSTSHLIIKAKSLADASLREGVMKMFTDEGIHANRVELLSWTQSTEDHLNVYNRIDIALDTFPYNGTTTTCEALWMGVPVITFRW